MIDEILDLFGRNKRKTSGAKPGGLGGILGRVQHALDDDGHRPSRPTYRDDDRRHDDDRYDDDRYDDHHAPRRGGRRERDGFDLGDD